MKRILPIFRDGLFAYFYSPVAYIVISVFLLITGWFFTSQLFIVNQSSLRMIFSIIPFIFIFFIPAITMRLISEERRSGTIELLFTMPITDMEILLGKYFSALGLLLTALFFTLPFAVTVMILGEPDIGMMFTGYVGIVLMGAAYIAIGIFASTISKNQVVSFIVSFLIIFFLWLLNQFLMIIPPALVPFFQFLSIDYHFANIARGVIDSRDVIYYLSLIAFMLTLGKVSMERRKWSRIDVMSIASAVVFTAILVMVNVIGIRFFVRADLTSANIYSLSNGSKEIVSNLEDRVLVKAYFSPNLPGKYSEIERYLRDLLEDYRAFSRGNLEYEFINPGNEETLREEAQSFQIPPRQFQVVANDKLEVVLGYTGVAFIYGDKKETIPMLENIDNLEYEITSIIKRLSLEQKPKVGLATLGGTPDMNPNEINQTAPGGNNILSLSANLKKNYDIIDVDLNEPIDTSLDALVVMAPREPFTDWMLFNIDQYMMNGGKLSMFMNWYNANLQTSQSAFPFNLNVNSLINNYGLGLGEDLVSDAQCATASIQRRQGFITFSQPVQVPYLPAATNFSKSHIITRDLQQLQMYYPSSVDTTLAAAKGYESGVLLTSSAKARRDSGPVVYLDIMEAPKQEYAESSIPFAGLVTGQFSSLFAESGPPERLSETGDETAPAFDGEFKTSSAVENRFILVGDGNFGLDNYLGENEFLFVQNVIDWLIQSEDLIGIRSKQIPMSPLKEIPVLVRQIIKWFNLLGPTMLIIALGIVLWQIRRIKNRMEMSR
ncbi:Gldg family protein [Candidatus Latescibacterota bacterium]